MANICNCEACGAGDLYVSRSQIEECYYCSSCGLDWKIKRDLPKEDWVDKKVQMNQKKVANLNNKRRF